VFLLFEKDKENIVDSKQRNNVEKCVNNSTVAGEFNSG
jgi:hypothetical protein